MRLLARTALLAIVVATMACSQADSMFTPATPTAVSNASADVTATRPASVLSAVADRMTATVQFGQTNVGTTFPPTSGHDRSAHAIDNMVPRTVVIDKGGTVTFNTIGVHVIAIYAPGTEPDDIDTSILSPTPTDCPKPGGAPLLIDDPENRVKLFAEPCGGPRTVKHTFEEPGRYLVICAFLPHFQVQMWGWVEVKDR